MRALTDVGHPRHHLARRQVRNLGLQDEVAVMRIAVIGLAIAALLVTGLGRDLVPASPAAGDAGPATNLYWTTGYGPPSQRVEFGHIVKLRREGAHWVMRFDPALILSGRTANVAAVADGAIARGEVVPNDNYVRDHDHALLTYVVADTARVRVFTRPGDKFGQSTIGVAELAKVLNGTSKIHMFEPLSTGVWINYHVDTVNRIQQEYHP